MEKGGGEKKDESLTQRKKRQNLLLNETHAMENYRENCDRQQGREGEEDREGIKSKQDKLRKETVKSMKKGKKSLGEKMNFPLSLLRLRKKTRFWPGSEVWGRERN